MAPERQSYHSQMDNNAAVNLDDCSISSDKGDSEIKTFWKDPEFRQDLSIILGSWKTLLADGQLGCHER